MQSEKEQERDALKKHVDDIVRLMEMQIESAREKQNIIENLLLREKEGREEPAQEEEEEQLLSSGPSKPAQVGAALSLLILLSVLGYFVFFK